MNRKLRPIKSIYQIKEEQVNFLVEDIEKNLEEYRKAIELRDKQLGEAKKILKGAKNSYDLLLKENKHLKEYIVNIKHRFKQYQQQQQQQELLQDREYFQRSPPKKYKKVVHKEKTDSKFEAVESQHVPENEPIEQEKQEQHKQINKVKIK